MSVEHTEPVVRLGPVERVVVLRCGGFIGNFRTYAFLVFVVGAATCFDRRDGADSASSTQRLPAARPQTGGTPART